jgi:hypothetical protein
VVKNYGGRTESFTAAFMIGSSYLDTFVVANLPSGDSTTVSFRQWSAMPRGKLYARCSTELEGDENPANDVAAESVMVRVLDVGVTQIEAPAAQVDSGMVVTPKVLVTNHGNTGVTFTAYMDIAGSPRESSEVTLAAGVSDTARFAAWTASVVGTHSVRCTTLLAGDMNPANNQMRDSVIVVAVPVGISAVNGGPLPVKFAINPGQPNPFLGRTVVRYALPKACDVALRVFNATGAVVRTLYAPGARPGYYEFVWDGRDNRGRAVGSGLYFCWLQAGESRGIIKIVKTD